MAEREQRDVYFIPQNFIDTGSIFGGSIRLRNAVEAAVLAAGTGIPLMYLPLPFNWRLILVIVISLPLAIFAIVGIEGDSLTEFLAHWFRFLRRRRIVTPTVEGNLEANKRRHLRFINRKRYRVVYYEDEAQLVQKVLKLTDAEIDLITRFERGNALISTNSNHVTVAIRCSRMEQELITTDREELRRIVERELNKQSEHEEDTL